MPLLPEPPLLDDKPSGDPPFQFLMPDLPKRRRWPAGDLAIPAVFLLLALGLRVADIPRFRFDTDEPQHLHVVWGWLHGLLQYRDVFDNHTPLFHLLCVPVLACFAPRADILEWMRLLVALPLYLASLGAVFLLGRALFSTQAGLWAAALTALKPRYFFTSLEYRTDDLWAPLCLFTIYWMVAKKKTPRHGLLAGLLLGAAYATSMKTSLLTLCLVLAGLAVMGFAWLRREKIDWPVLGRWLGAVLAGGLVVPLLVVGWLAWRGGAVELRAMFYGVIQHNLVSGLAGGEGLGWRVWTFPVALLPLLAVAFYWYPPERNAERASRHGCQALVALTAAFYYFLLRSYWPIITHEDYLPYYPIFFVVLAGTVFLEGRRWFPHSNVARSGEIGLLTGCLALSLWQVAHYIQPDDHSAQDFICKVQLILDATSPSDCVMDPKGEMIFHPRPYYYALETITKYRLSHHLLPDEIPQRLVETRTPVVFTEGLPPATVRFVEENYLPLRFGARILGQALQPPVPDGRHYRVNIVIPAEYLLYGAQGPLNTQINARIDGQPGGRALLTAGPHTIDLAQSVPDLRLVWAPAVDRGVWPQTPHHS